MKNNLGSVENLFGEHQENNSGSREIRGSLDKKRNPSFSLDSGLCISITGDIICKNLTVNKIYQHDIGSLISWTGS